MARHRIPGRPRRARPRLTAGGLLATAAALIVASSLGVLAAGGTYAYINASSAVVGTATLTAGTASLATSEGAVDFAALYPGQSRTGVYTVTNTGDAPLALAIASITGTTPVNGLVATIGGTCTSTQYTSGSFDAPTLAPGEATSLCLTVSMPVTAPASARGVTSPIVVTLTGVRP